MSKISLSQNAINPNARPFRTIIQGNYISIILIILISIPGLVSCSGDEPPKTPPLLLISIDGMMPGYLDRTDTPAFDRLAEAGVLAEHMIPVFPTKTFPNHYSLVTGLYTENTGVISNNMYDPEMDETFSLGNRAAVSDGRWYGGEPIWVTAEKQNVPAATMFWPGSEAEIGGVRPTRWMEYDGSIPYEARVDSVINWLQADDESRPGLITLYFSSVDTYGHRYGPASDSVDANVARVDRVLGYLLDELSRTGMENSVNIIITSDHGMAEISMDRVIILDEIIRSEDVQILDWTPVAMIQPKEGKKEEVYNLLKSAESNYSVYLKEDIPDVYRFKNHYRVPEIIMIADPGYTIISRDYLDRRGVSGGAHGYDHRVPEMQAFFLAAGPGIIKGETIDPFQSVHVYELMCKLLNLDPAPNDGHPDSLRHILN
jgi:predicted AlkP superfamily pyrophosphatase or phosphodiesterase